MCLLALPNEVLDIIIDLLNAPNDTFQYDSKLPVSTACLCKLDKIYAKAPEAYPIWPDWKRDSLALSSVCKAMRSMIFDRFWLKEAAMDWKRDALSKAQTALSVASCEKVQCVVSSWFITMFVLIVFISQDPDSERRLQRLYPKTPPSRLCRTLSKLARDTTRRRLPLCA
jgi:hypothetical protein